MDYLKKKLVGVHVIRAIKSLFLHKEILSYICENMLATKWLTIGVNYNIVQKEATFGFLIDLYWYTIQSQSFCLFLFKLEITWCTDSEGCTVKKGSKSHAFQFPGLPLQTSRWKEFPSQLVSSGFTRVWSSVKTVFIWI